MTPRERHIHDLMTAAANGHVVEASRSFVLAPGQEVTYSPRSDTDHWPWTCTTPEGTVCLLTHEQVWIRR